MMNGNFQNDVVDVVHVDTLSLHHGRVELERRLSMISSQLDSDRDVSDLLECPVCLERCDGVAFICRYGHLICGECKIRGNLISCPTCRNQNLQELAKFPELVKKYESFTCPNGCGHLATDDRSRLEHRAACSVIWRKCPLSDCDVNGPGLDIRTHLILQHPEICFAFGAKLTVGLGQSPETRTAFLLGFENIIIFQFQQKNGFNCSAFYLDPGEENLFVKLIFRNESKVKRILIPVLKKSTNEGFTSSYRDMIELVQGVKGESSAVTINLTVNISVTKLPVFEKSGTCNHGQRRCLLVCPDFNCNKQFSCQVCHNEIVEDHLLDLTMLREVICKTCSFTQTPAQKCVSCLRVLE